jgi:pimeloyl-ACP methyl ester carboxylesterase
MKPTIVFVHGAFTESSSWHRVIELLDADGYTVIAVANPLRDVASDAAGVDDLIRTIDGPVVLVAHSYGGAVMSNVAADTAEIVGLVYVNGFAPDPDESCFSLVRRFAGSTLDDGSVRPLRRSDGATDLYIARDRYHDLFCADLPAAEAARMAATQRPVTQEALFAGSGERPLWRELPSWFVIGAEDRIIPAALQCFMAERAGVRRALVIAGASHALSVSQPQATADVIREAAATNNLSQ